MNKLVTNTLIGAMTLRKTRKGQLKFLTDRLNCNNTMAKHLLFAFWYKAEEKYLRAILDGDVQPRF